MTDLTGTQLETARFIWLYTKRNGFPPTFREIGEEFEINVHSVQERIRAMKKKGVFVGRVGISFRSLTFTHEFKGTAQYKLMVQIV